jgi:hypothetical protein
MDDRTYRLTSWLLFLPGVFLRVWTLSVLWLWFVVPEFRVSPLTLHGSFGIMLIIGFLITKVSDVYAAPQDDEERQSRALRQFFASFIAPLLCLFIGFIGHKLLA